MKHASIVAVLLLLGLVAQTSTALASGADGHRVENNIKPEPDPKFEAGKAIFTGRDQNAPSLKYCVFHRGKLLKVKRSTIKQFRKASIPDFEAGILDCANPVNSVFAQLEDEHRELVTYYLDKRYWLRLKGLNTNY